MNKELLRKELKFRAVRSSGAGGQHVNKVASKVALTFSVVNSNAFTEKEKARVIKNLANQLTKEGVLHLTSSDSRSQHTNKEKVIKRFFLLIEKALTIPKKRKPTQISLTQKQKRLDNKRLKAHKKTLRKKPPID